MLYNITDTCYTKMSVFFANISVPIAFCNNETLPNLRMSGTLMYGMPFSVVFVHNKAGMLIFRVN